jgi:anti-sigma regulatory factor (Ser/Thr protein kinase)
MPAEHHRFHVVASQAGFERGAAFFGSALDASRVTGRRRYHAELVFEEIVGNIIRHGYKSDGAGRVDVDVECTPTGVTLIFEDAAPHFDPLALPDPVPAHAIEDVPDGGRGLLLVRKIATHVEYEGSSGTHNRLRVTLGQP